MLVYGKNSCEEILKQGKDIKRVYLERNFKDKVITGLIEKLKIKPVFLTKYELDEMTLGNHQGVAVDVLEFKYADIDEIIKENGFIVMLDHLEDTHNFGAIIRTCEAAGVDGIIIPKDRSVSVNETVMKCSAGTLNHVNIIEVTNLVNAINYLKDLGFFIYGAEADGVLYNQVDYSDKICLVIGSEGKGISNIVRKNCDEIISLPMRGHINSLNASVAAAILIYGIGD